MDLKLTNADINAIDDNNSDYILNHGAKLYNEETYAQSVEYYRLASAMGNVHATSNLGYCYLYGRDIPVNVDLAIQYFRIAARNGDLDAIYKLGDIYSRDKWGKEDKEMSLYYYQIALDFLVEEFGTPHLYDEDLPLEYPSLFFALGRESMPGGSMNTNLIFAYEWLKIAQKGYEIQIANGSDMYEDSLESVNKLLENDMFEEAKKEFESTYNWSLDDEE